MNSLFDFNNPLFTRRLLAGSYRPDRLMNSSLFSNLPKILPVDVNEKENNYTIIADLPGFEEDNIAVNIENNVLSIIAEQEVEEKDDENSEDDSTSRNIVKERIFHKRTERNINLGSRRFDIESITADLKNGVLTVVIPFAEESLPKKIEVKVSNEKIEEELSNDKNQGKLNLVKRETKKDK